MGARWALNSSSWTPTEKEWLSALSRIQSEEVKRIGEFVYQRDAKFAVIGRLLIRAGLAEHMGGAFQCCPLGRTARGKPVLLPRGGRMEGQAEVSFNVSHQGDYVVLATELNGPVGVDIMQFSRPCNTNVEQFFCTMKRQFTSDEWDQINTPVSSEAHRLRNFYRFWSLKESFIKGDGTGLAYGLQNLKFVCDADWPLTSGTCCVNSKLYIKGILTENWRFEESLIGEDHCVSVAVGGTKAGVVMSGSAKDPPPFSLLTVQNLLKKVQAFPEPDDLLLRKEWEHFKKKKYSPLSD